ncbi:flagellar assembly protein FliW [Virgibacillus sp. FSP13]
MKLNTKYVGQINVEDKRRITFRTGLPGFDEQTEFVLLDFPGNPVFQFLQSVTTENLAFIVTNPYHFYQEYAFDLDDTILDNLQIESEQDVAVLSIVTLKNPFNTSTLNLKAPVIVNLAKQLGKQYIITTDEYPSKAPIFPSESFKRKENHHARINQETK